MKAASKMMVEGKSDLVEEKKGNDAEQREREREVSEGRFSKN